MNSVPQVKMKCAVCGAESSHPTADASSCSYGPRDLDTRPPLPLRAELPALVLCCPSCGYCARNLMEADERAGIAIRTPEYEAQLVDAAFPTLANRFLCAALVADARDQFAYAMWSRVHAAWACDDKDDADAARTCRNRAIETFRKAAETGTPVVDGAQGEFLLLAELLRRAGRFDEARAEIEKGLAAAPPPVLENLFRLEERLVEAADAGCHTVPPGDPLA